MSTVNLRDFIYIEDIIIIAVAMFPEFKWVDSMCLSKCHLLMMLSTLQIGIYNLANLSMYCLECVLRKIRIILCAL